MHGPHTTLLASKSRDFHCLKVNVSSYSMSATSPIHYSPVIFDRVYSFIISNTECNHMHKGYRVLYLLSLLGYKTLNLVAPFGELAIVVHSQFAVFAAVNIYTNTKDVHSAAVMKSVVKSWRMARSFFCSTSCHRLFVK